MNWKQIRAKVQIYTNIAEVGYNSNLSVLIVYYNARSTLRVKTFEDVSESFANHTIENIKKYGTIDSSRNTIIVKVNFQIYDVSIILIPALDSGYHIIYRVGRVV